MKVFRFFIITLFFSTLTYTIIVGNNHGWDLFNIFFADISQMTWPGQFDLDFMCHLMISGLWISWRNNFSAKGLVLGLFGLVGGILFLAPYLLILSFKVNGDMKELFLGKIRANG